MPEVRRTALRASDAPLLNELSERDGEAVSGHTPWSEIKHKRDGYFLDQGEYEEAKYAPTLPTLDILIASVNARHDQLVALLDHLAPQLEPFDGRARVLVNRDDAVAPVGAKRNQILLAATAEYVAYVDDDDWVDDDYVGRVMEALVERPDVIGFKLRYLVDGAEMKPAIHSITNVGWDEKPDHYARSLTHLNPLKRKLALRGLPFQPGFGEDRDWAERVMATGLVRNETFLAGTPLYIYRYSSTGSLFAGGVRHVGTAPVLPGYEHVASIRPVI